MNTRFCIKFQSKKWGVYSHSKNFTRALLIRNIFKVRQIRLPYSRKGLRYVRRWLKKRN